jgi:RNA polymerase sigma-70 factor, ECF subfamily
MADELPALVSRAQDGDRDALQALIVSQQSYVYSIAKGIMRSDPDAADMTQESFVRLLRSIRTYRAETKFTTWLYRLVTNICLDELRRRGAPTAVFDDVVTVEAADPDPWAQPEKWAAAVESASEVRTALEQLSMPQRLALTLFYFQDLRYEDIADVMGVPLNTVKSHIRRAKERLAEILSLRQNGTEAIGCSAAT